jgi:peptidoglycan/xylan/chitin deacetylase (PgdA/CDA1 family)
MRLLSPILQRMVYPALGSVGYFHSRAASDVSVITYHGVLPFGYQSKYPLLDDALMSEAAFRSQLQLLKKYYNVISPDQFLGWLRRQEDLPERAVLLTCDDGLLNHLTVMLPILQEAKLKCLFFVTGGSLTGTPTDTPEMLWYTELYLMLMGAPEQDKPLTLLGTPIPGISSDPSQRRILWLELMRVMSRMDADGRRMFIEEGAAIFGLHPAWRSRFLDDPLLRARFKALGVPELKQLIGAGMTIGAHSLSHPMLAEQSTDLARAEIAECRTALEHALGRPVWSIAYPFGDPASVGEREFALAEEAGYDCAFANVGGVLNSASPRFALPRIHVTAAMSQSVYEAYISGFHHALRSRLKGERKAA